MNAAIRFSTLFLGLLLLVGCNPVRPLPPAAAAETPATADAAGTVGLTYVGPAELGSGDSSRCAMLQIDNRETAQLTACDGTLTKLPLPANVAATWQDAVDRFGAFTYTTPSEEITFQGAGQLDDPVWQRALLTWASVTRAELAGGQSSATAQTALSWNLGQLPDTPGVCAHLTVLFYGYAYAEQRSCTNSNLVTAAEDWLGQTEMEQFDRWLYGFAPLYVNDNYLDGIGASQLPKEEAAAVEEWAQAVWTRLAGLPLAPAVTCDDPAAGEQAYVNTGYGFCLLIPAGYSVVETAPNNYSLVAGGDIMNHTAPRVSIEVSPASDRTFAEIAQQFVNDFVLAGQTVTPENMQVDGVEAVLLNNLPGQDTNRRIIALHNGSVYSLMFAPLTAEAEPLYQAVLASLRFLPEP